MVNQEAKDFVAFRQISLRADRAIRRGVDRAVRRAGARVSGDGQSGGRLWEGLWAEFSEGRQVTIPACLGINPRSVEIGPTRKGRPA